MRTAMFRAFQLLVVAVVGWALPAAVVAAPPETETQWEYRVLTREQLIDLGKKDLTAGLNRLGEDGWELAAVESGYIFKRPRQQKTLEGIKRQLAAIAADVEMLKDRAAWSKRMVQKGFLTEQQAQADVQRLKEAESALEKAKKELEAFPAEPKPAPEKKPNPDK